ncbi:hypothetical protein ACFL0Q_08580, partial [Thermodesulfobacteriota bacterium]
MTLKGDTILKTVSQMSPEKKGPNRVRIWSDFSIIPFGIQDDTKAARRRRRKRTALVRRGADDAGQRRERLNRNSEHIPRSLL